MKPSSPDYGNGRILTPLKKHVALASDLGVRLGGKKGLLERALRRHVENILSGVGSGEDYRALIQDLRFRCKGKRKFREVSDFLSHRDVRDRGPVTNLVRDIFVSARVFAMILGNQIPTVADARAAAHANLRLTTDATIAAECAMSRAGASLAIDHAANLLARGLYPGDRERFVFNVYGNRLKWRPAFHDHELLDEFVAVLFEAKLLRLPEVTALRRHGAQLSLFALALLHGSEIQVTTAERVVLQAAFFNQDRRLEVKAYLTFKELKKPIHMPLCVFLTELQPEPFCDADLLASEPHGWDMPLRLSPDWRLTANA